MRRLAGVGLFLILLLSLGLSGCGGGSGSSSSGGVGPTANVVLIPAGLSLEVGAVTQVVVNATDSAGHPVFTSTPIFTSSNTAVITVSNAGLVCAGTWDSLTTPVVCTPAAAGGTSNLTATVGGITSNIVVVSVHLHVDSITLSPASVDCKSQNATQIFTATAFNGGVNITSTVGTFTWLSSDTTVATIDVAGPATTPVLAANQAQIKAAHSGLTNISASISGTNSVAAPFITCSPATISIHVQSLPDTSFSIATGATKQLVADVVDTLGVTITGLTLTWTSSQPAIASVSTAGLVTGVAPGVSVITASCTPSSCNPGVNQSVYSNPVTATITGTAATTTAYATTTTAPASGGHSDLIPISTSTNTAGTAIALPTDAAINSLLMNPAGTRAFLGSSKGLVVVDVTANTVLATVSNALGKALAISPNGQFIVSSDIGASKVYVYDSVNNLVTTLNIAGATHAAFTTDSFKAYIVAGSTLYQYSPSLTLRTIPMTAAANDVAVNSSGQFAYTAGGEAASVAARSTCRNDSTWAPEDSVATGATPDLIAPVATGELLAVEGASSEIDKITPTISAPTAGTSCPPGLGDALATANFGVGAFTARQLIVTSDGSKAFVTSNQASILLFNVAGATTNVIPLAGGGTQSFTGGVTLDGKNLYVGVGGVNAVHRIDTTVAPATADVQQIPVSFVPDLVAVRPH
ncbi:MAG: Ig-like domain-containing protein [Acidobacteriota bacterium]|nr:Ig-like domain-containing protein [Acidobacteriota bacterium]